MIEKNIICPLGCDCEKVNPETGKLDVCAWYQSVTGKHPQTGEELKQHHCALVLNNILLMESSKHIRGLQRATENLRNETINVPAALMKAMKGNGLKEIPE